MVKNFLFKTMLLLCALIVGGSSVWADDVTLSYSGSTTTNMTGNNDAATVGLDASHWSVVGSKGSASNLPGLNKDGTIRLYYNASGSNTITVSNLDSYTISSIEVTYKPNNANGTITVGGSEVTATGTGETKTYAINATSFVIGNGNTSNVQVHIVSVKMYYTTTGGGQTTTYTVTYDANGGTGTMTDADSPYTAGATVTVLGNTFTRDGYTFDHWNTAADGNGTDYDEDDTFTINANTTLYAQWNQNSGGGGNTGNRVLTFDLTSNPGGWPTANSTTLTDYTYTLNSVDYTFGLKNVKCNSGYLMMTSVAVLGLPAIEGYKLTKVVASNSSGCSTSTKVGISSSASQESYVSGGSAQTWSTTGSSYTYNLSSTEANTVYYLYVTNKNAQVTSLELTYEPTSGTPSPSISADNVNITYDATGGSITYTINNEVSGGSVSAAVTDGNWVTLGQGTTSPISFTCSANTESTARTATVTLTYTYNTNETITKNVTITQAAAPVVYSTIPALFAAATSTETPVNVTFNNWVVSGVSTNGKNVFVTDNSDNGFVLYYNSDMSSTYSAGDILSGTAVSGSLKLYNGFAELLNVDANDLTITSGGTVTAANITMANLAGVNTGALVSYQGLTCSVNSNKYYLSDGTTTLQVFNSLYAFDALEDGKTYNITGVYQQYNSTKEILPRSAADIVEVVITTPSISVATNTINAAYAGASGTIDVTYNNITTVVADVYFYESDGTTPATYNWIDAEINSTTNNVDYVIDANTGAARTAYMKVYAIGDNSEDVYSELITISQAQFAVSVAQAVFKKVTSGSEIAAGNQYLIVYEGTTSNKVFTGISSDVGQQEEIVIDNGIITDAGNGAIVVLEDAGIRSTGELDVQQWYIKHGTMYLSAPSSNKLNEVSTTSDNAKWENLPDEIYNYTTSRYLQYNASQPRFCCYQSSSNMKDVSLYRMVEQITPAKAMVSYCSVNDLDFTGMDLHAYVVSNVANGKAQIKEEAGIPANQGMILKGTASTTYDVPVVATAPTLTNTNMLIGTTAMTNVEAETGYTFLALSNGEFVVMNPGQVKPNKAYLKVNSSILGDSSKLALSFDDNDATAINDINANKQDGVYYNLNGMRVNAPQKGIYILNGKKIVVK